MTPKQADRVIRKTFRVKRRDTLPYTGWLRSTREDLAKIYNTLGYKVGAEIGVLDGRHSRIMMENVPGLKLFCIDPWVAFNRMSEEKIAKIYKRCQDRLKNYDVEYMRMTSMEAIEKIPDRSLDFVYIDGLHEFDSIMMDLIHWSKKVRFGGIVAGHDYFANYQMGVMDAANAYTGAHNINDWYVTVADEYPSFFWVQKEEYQQGYG